MNVTAFYEPVTCCRSGPASCCFESHRNNGAMTPAGNLYIQFNDRVIDYPNKLLRLLIRQLAHSTSNSNLLIPIACTLIKVHL